MKLPPIDFLNLGHIFYLRTINNFSQLNKNFKWLKPKPPGAGADPYWPEAELAPRPGTFKSRDAQKSGDSTTMVTGKENHTITVGVACSILTGNSPSGSAQ